MTNLTNAVPATVCPASYAFAVTTPDPVTGANRVGLLSPVALARAPLVASASELGVVRIGAGLEISTEGVLTPDGTVFVLRSAVATVAISGAYADLIGRPAFGGAAALNVGQVSGTVAAGDDARIVGAYQTSNPAGYQTAVQVSAAIQGVIGTAPSALATLGAIAAEMGSDESAASALTLAVAAKAPLASPAFTGMPTGPTPAAGNNSTLLATTGFVAAAVAAVPVLTIGTSAETAYPGNNPLGFQTAAQVTAVATAAMQSLLGTATGALVTLGAIDAQMATDEGSAAALAALVATKAPTASPALTGVPTAPTASVGTATGQIATTAFVGAALTSFAPSGSGVVVATGATYTMSLGVLAVIVRQTTPVAITVTLPTSPVNWTPYVVKDGAGAAATAPITVSAGTGTIDGAASYVLSTAWESVTLMFDGSKWSVV